MKHVRQITKNIPAPAAPWQDALCVILQFANDLLGVKGGSLPLLDLIDEKCEPVVPDPS